MRSEAESSVEVELRQWISWGGSCVEMARLLSTLFFLPLPALLI